MEKKEITDPSMGSNELGRETSEDTHSADILAGTDTQLRLAVLSGKKHKRKKNVGNDEKVIKNPSGENKFLKSDETDE